MLQYPNRFIFSFLSGLLVVSLTKTKAQNIADGSIFSTTKVQPYNFTLLYTFDENQKMKTSFFLKPHDNYLQLLGTNYSCLIYKIDKPMVVLQLDLTQRELDEEKARIEHYKCTEKDKTRIETEKALKEKIKN